MAQSPERRYLEKARSIIADRNKWTKGVFSRFDHLDQHLTYCSLGAIWQAAGLLNELGMLTDVEARFKGPVAKAEIVFAKTVSPNHAEACLEGKGMAKELGGVMRGIEAIIAEFNDNSPHSIVVKAFDEALKNV